MRTLLAGSANPHKLEEIRSLLAGLPVRVVGLDALAGAAPDVDEHGATFAENARIKAAAYALAAARRGRPAEPAPAAADWVIADDSGLCVDALDGAPGVRSARYAGERANAGENNRKLLETLRGVPPEARTARFVCAIACAEVPRSGGEPRVIFEVEGTCPGTIAEAPRGSGGFGYDPLFIDASLGRTFAEIGPDEKNRRSHRGAALRRFRELFLEAIDGG